MLAPPSSRPAPRREIRAISADPATVPASIDDLAPGKKSLDLGADSKVYAYAMALKVSELAGRVGLTADTVRYYERLGLLPEPSRSASGYRQYDEELADRLRFIRGAQRFGLRLGEIKELLDIQDNGRCPCGHTQDLLRSRVAEVDRELLRLEQLRTELLTMIQRADCDAPAAMAWPCAVDFIEGRGCNDERADPV
jgi:DNA-binding transcriptional MerR regulator